VLQVTLLSVTVKSTDHSPEVEQQLQLVRDCVQILVAGWHGVIVARSSMAAVTAVPVCDWSGMWCVLLEVCEQCMHVVPAIAEKVPARVLQMYSTTPSLADRLLIEGDDASVVLSGWDAQQQDLLAKLAQVKSAQSKSKDVGRQRKLRSTGKQADNGSAGMAVAPSAVGTGACEGAALNCMVHRAGHFVAYNVAYLCFSMVMFAAAGLKC